MILNVPFEATKKLRLAILDNSEVVAEHFRSFLSEHPAVQEVEVVFHSQYYLDDLIRRNADVVLLNRSFYTDGFQHQLKSIRENCPQMVIIVCVDDFSEDYKELCIKTGAHFVYDRLHDLSELNTILFKIQGLIK